MHWFCPKCWSEVSEGDRVCGACRTILEQADHRGLVEKLLAALRHPEPATAVRAATILGELKPQEAVSALADILGTSRDPYLIEAAARALGKIGDRNSVPVLRATLCSSYLVARLAAAEALARVGGPEAVEALEAGREDRSHAVRATVSRLLSELTRLAAPLMEHDALGWRDSRNDNYGS